MPDVGPEIPIFIPPPETDQAPRTIEEEIKIREQQGFPVPPASPAFPSASPPIVPSPKSSGDGWALAAVVAAYWILG